MSETGKYFVVEGNDGTGKSTQVELLASYLRDERNIETFVTHEPGGTPVADAIREVIKNGDLERDADTNILLFTAARHEIWQRAKAELVLGKYVLSARNYLSTLAYQVWGEKQPGPLTEVMRLSAEVIDITRKYTDERYMQPDGLILLELDDANRQSRIDARGTLISPDTFEKRGAQFQRDVNMGYDYHAELAGAVRVDASLSIEEIQATIRKIFDV